MEDEFLFLVTLILGMIWTFFHWYKDRRKLVIQTNIHQQKFEEINVGGWTESGQSSMGASAAGC